jgi:prevent-host-death family protein
MNIPITEAKAQLTELVRRAEGGEVVVLTRHGKPAVRLVPAEGATPVPRKLDRALIDEITRRAVAKFKPGELPTSNHDDMYDEGGLPK